MVLSLGARRLAQGLLASLVAFLVPAGVAAQLVVTPQGTWTASRTIHTAGYTQTFRVTNEAASDQYVTFSCSGQSGIVCTGLNKTSATIPGNSFTNVIATYSTGNEGTGQLTLSAGYEQGWVFVPIVLPAGAPRMDVLPYLEANQDLGRCALSCFTATHAQSTVPYVALDAPRSATLVYHGDRLSPKPFVAVDVYPDTTFGTWPSEYQLQVKVAGSFVTFLNGETLLRFTGTSGSTRYRLAGQFDASTGYTHGTVYPLEILVTAKIGSTLYTNRWITRYLHVNTADLTSALFNGIAKGWTLAGLQRLVGQSDGSKLILEGNGTAVFFKYDSLTQTIQAPTGEFSTLKASGSTWVRAYPDSTKLTFTSAGLLAKITDRWGNRDSIVYDGSNRVTQLKDPLNNTITLAYGANGLSSITDPFGRATQITVDASKRLTAIQDPDGVSTTFGYDGSLRLQTLTNRGGKTTTLYYNSQSGKLDSIQAPAIPVFGGGTQSPVTRLVAWQQKGVPYGATSGTPFTSLPVDSAYARVTEPGGAVSRFTVNRWGSPAQSTNALGEVTTVTYTVHGHPARVVAPGYGSAYDSLAYNANGLVVYSKPAADMATTIQYGGWAQPTLIGKAQADTTRFYLGANGRLDSVRVGNVTIEKVSSYDSYGRPLSVRRPNSDTTGYAYFSTGAHRNLSTVTLSGGRTTTLRYDTRGLLNYQKPPLLLADSVEYDLLNRVTVQRKVTAGPAIVTSLQYDSLSRVVQVTDPELHTYRYRYNALGWLIRQEDPAGLRDTAQYSVDGDVLRATDRRNLDVDFSYDALHRVTSSVGSGTTSYAYELNGLRLAAASPVATDTIFFNPRQQPDSAVTRMAGQRYLRRYHYTAAGLLDSVYVSGGVTLTTRGYGYDAAKGVLTAIKLGTAVTTITPNPALQDGQRVLPGNGGTITRTFGSLRAPVKITSSAQPAATERWIGFDQLGRITQQLTYGGEAGRFFVYDSQGRLTGAADSVITSGTPPQDCPLEIYGVEACHSTGGVTWGLVSGTTMSATYDLVGNRTSGGGTYASGTNRITAFDGCTYLTDAAGSDSVRTCGSVATTFAWNKEGQLTGLTVTGQAAVTFAYDGFGRLVKKTSGDSTSYFLWEGDHLLAELGGSGTTVIAEYSYYPGMDRLHAVTIAGTRYYAHQDGLGSVVALTDEAGALNRTLAYDDWGQLVGATDPAAVFGNRDRARWKGALWLGPETDIYYMRNRWYEPKTGRFVSEDPIGLEGGINPFVFGRNDPIDTRDPTGLSEECWTVSGIADDVDVVAPDGRHLGRGPGRYCITSGGGAGGSRTGSIPLSGNPGRMPKGSKRSTPPALAEVKAFVGCLASEFADNWLTTNEVLYNTAAKYPRTAGSFLAGMAARSRIPAQGFAGLARNYIGRGLAIGGRRVLAVMAGGQLYAGVQALGVTATYTVVTAAEITAAFELGITLGSAGHALGVCTS